MRICARPVAEGIHPDGDIAGQVGIGLGDGNPRPQASEALITKWRQFEPAAIECERRKKIEILIDQPESARHHSHHLARLAVDHHALTDRRARSAKAALPVSVAEHDSLCPVRILIYRGKQAACERRNLERFKYTEADQSDMYLFGLRQPRNRGPVRRPDAERLKCTIMLAEREIHRRGESQPALKIGQAAGAGRIQPERDQAV